MSSYYSYMCSKWHKMFVELGYPRLDIVEFGDGEFAIREFETIPVIPCLTKWKYILTGMRNIEITRAFCSKYVDQIDPMKQQMWDRENAKSAALDAQEEDRDRHKEDMAERGRAAIMNNPDLVERIARNGLGEMSLKSLAKTIGNSNLRQFGDSISFKK